MLQRLPYLGRVASGSSDRIFIDSYAKDGLRGISEAQVFLSSDKEVSQSNWQQPLGDFGVRVLGSRITSGPAPDKFARMCTNHGNFQVACDYIGLKILQSGKTCNFQGLNLIRGHIPKLNFIEKEFKNLSLSGIEIDEVVVESATFESILISDCIIHSIKGVGSTDKLPDVFQKCEIGEFDAALTISRISELHLSDSHKTLLALIKKLFFQPGAGRQEEALLRGAESYWDNRTARKVLAYMLNYGLIRKIAGDHGSVFVPRRAYTNRMGHIWELQSNCGDDLWALAAE